MKADSKPELTEPKAGKKKKKEVAKAGKTLYTIVSLNSIHPNSMYIYLYE